MLRTRVLAGVGALACVAGLMTMAAAPASAAPHRTAGAVSAAASATSAAHHGLLPAHVFAPYFAAVRATTPPRPSRPAPNT